MTFYRFYTCRSQIDFCSVELLHQGKQVSEDFLVVYKLLNVKVLEFSRRFLYAMVIITVQKTSL